MSQKHGESAKLQIFLNRKSAFRQIAIVLSLSSLFLFGAPQKWLLRNEVDLTPLLKAHPTV